MLAPVQESHYGYQVWVSPAIEYQRRDECLCLHCGKLKDCATAKTLYQICCAQNLALAVSRCLTWEKADAAPEIA